MFGRRKKKTDLNLVALPPDGGKYFMDDETLKYINKLREELDNVKFEKIKLEKELKAIKPVIENKKLKPAISAHCLDCKFVVKSNWNGNILGCKKDCVCDSFCPNDI